MDALGFMAFGWGAGFFALVAGYFLLRFRTRRYWQSAFIAALCLGWILAAAEVGGMLSRPVALVLVLCGDVFGTVFLLGLVDELRRGAFRKKPRGDLD